MTEKENKETLVLTQKNTYIWAVLLIGWLFDLLFWDKVPGISIPIYIAILLTGGFVLARRQKLSAAPGIFWLLIPISFFSIMAIVRLEPLTTFLNIVASLTLMGVIAHSFLGGKWWQYSFKDYLTGSLSLGLDTLIRPVAVYSSQPKPENEDQQDQTGKKQGIRKSLSVLRGLLIAFPIVLVFAGMLAEADPIFDQALSKFLEIFHIENLGEYIVRAFLISIIAYLVLGIYLHAFYKDHDQNLSSEKARWLPAFLGITEAAIVLGSINLLFLSFVAVQFQYFFGGQENINLAGYTFAEYARRGFGELVAVALFSLLLFMGLSFITKKEGKPAQRVFSILGIVLFALVAVILVSSFQRLLLYEQAYGFTRLRTYTHVFIIWLGILLLAVSLLELFRKQRYFAFAALIAGLGFIITLDLINVDALIVKQNFSRIQEGEPLDITYLASLSEDALPTLYEYYASSDRQSGKETLAGAIACHAEVNDHYDYPNHPYRNYTWQSFHFSRSRAQNMWTNLTDSSDPDRFAVEYYDETSDPWNSYVVIEDEKVPCSGYYWD
jgi:hypothetical protein